MSDKPESPVAVLQEQLVNAFRPATRAKMTFEQAALAGPIDLAPGARIVEAIALLVADRLAATFTPGAAPELTTDRDYLDESPYGFTSGLAADLVRADVDEDQRRRLATYAALAITSRAIALIWDNRPPIHIASPWDAPGAPPAHPPVDTRAFKAPVDQRALYELLQDAAFETEGVLCEVNHALRDILQGGWDGMGPIADAFGLADAQRTDKAAEAAAHERIHAAAKRAAGGEG